MFADMVWVTATEKDMKDVKTSPSEAPEVKLTDARCLIQVLDKQTLCLRHFRIYF